MKAKSPSCGYKRIYDGTFSKTLRRGERMYCRGLIEMNNIEFIRKKKLTY